MTQKEFKAITDFLKTTVMFTRYEGHVYAVGGACRDYRLGREIKDIDLVVDLPHGGIDFANYLLANGYLTHDPVIYENFGTVMFTLKAFPTIELEAVHTRKECYRNEDSRNPETMFGTIHDDCTRRDFTYNAIYMNISTGEFEDLNGKSFEDLDANILRTCGDPDIIFTEDPLRILRAIRFACRYDSIIDQATFNGMMKYADRLSIISQERITDEFNKIIASPHPSYGLSLMLETHVIDTIFPEFFEDHHLAFMPHLWKNIVLSKKLDTIQNLVDNLPIQNNPLTLRLAAMFDNCYATVDIMTRMKYPTNIIKRVDFIRTTSIYTAVPSEIREVQYMCSKFKHFGTDDYTVADVMNLFDEVVALNKSVAFSPDYNIGDIDEVISLMDNAGKSFYDYTLPINGNDVMEVLGIPAGPKVKEILEESMYYAFRNPSITKDELIDLMIKRFKK